MVQFTTKLNLDFSFNLIQLNNINLNLNEYNGQYCMDI